MTHMLSNKFLKISGLLICTFLFCVSVIASVVFGLTEISWNTAVEALINYDESSNEHIIIQIERMPRAFIAASVGASLAIASAIMQALTRNPLASPDVFGVNAGAAFFIVFAVSFLSVSSVTGYIWLSFFGAGIGVVLVYILGSLGRDGLTPMKILLGGAGITALFSSLTQGILVTDERGFEEVLFWLTGSVSGRTLEMLTTVLPFFALGWIASLLIANPINILMMGEDVAKGLGQRTTVVKIVIVLIIMVLAGGSVAVAGPIGFIGIIIPHIARFLVGTDYRWIIPYSAFLGSILLLVADILARFVISPQEMAVGVMTALIGTPFFIYIARRGFKQA